MMPDWEDVDSEGALTRRWLISCARMVASLSVCSSVGLDRGGEPGAFEDKELAVGRKYESKERGCRVFEADSEGVVGFVVDRSVLGGVVRSSDPRISSKMPVLTTIPDAPFPPKP